MKEPTYSVLPPIGIGSLIPVENEPVIMNPNLIKVEDDEKNEVYYKYLKQEKMFKGHVINKNTIIFYFDYDDLIDPDSLVIEIEIANPNKYNYLQLDNSVHSLIKRTQWVYKDKILEQIDDYYLLMSLLNDIEYKTNKYADNIDYIKHKKEEEFPLTYGTRELLLHPRVYGTEFIFNNQVIQTNFLKKHEIIEGKIDLRPKTQETIIIPIFSYIFCNGPQRKTKMLDLGKFRGLQLRIELNEYAFFVPCFNATINEIVNVSEKDDVGFESYKNFMSDYNAIQNLNLNSRDIIDLLKEEDPQFKDLDYMDIDEKNVVNDLFNISPSNKYNCLKKIGECIKNITFTYANLPLLEFIICQFSKLIFNNKENNSDICDDNSNLFPFFFNYYTHDITTDPQRVNENVIKPNYENPKLMNLEKYRHREEEEMPNEMLFSLMYAKRNIHPRLEYIIPFDNIKLPNEIHRNGWGRLYNSIHFTLKKKENASVREIPLIRQPYIEYNNNICLYVDINNFELYWIEQEKISDTTYNLFMYNLMRNNKKILYYDGKMYASQEIFDIGDMESISSLCDNILNIKKNHKNYFIIISIINSILNSKANIKSLIPLSMMFFFDPTKEIVNHIISFLIKIIKNANTENSDKIQEAIDKLLDMKYNFESINSFEKRKQSKEEYEKLNKVKNKYNVIVSREYDPIEYYCRYSFYTYKDGKKIDYKEKWSGTSTYYQIIEKREFNTYPPSKVLFSIPDGKVKNIYQIIISKAYEKYPTCRFSSRYNRKIKNYFIETQYGIYPRKLNQYNNCSFSENNFLFNNLSKSFDVDNSAINIYNASIDNNTQMYITKKLNNNDSELFLFSEYANHLDNFLFGYFTEINSKCVLNINIEDVKKELKIQKEIGEFYMCIESDTVYEPEYKDNFANYEIITICETKIEYNIDNGKLNLK